MLKGRRIRFGSADGYVIDSPALLGQLEGALGHSLEDRRHFMLNERNVEFLGQREYLVGLNTLGQKMYLFLCTLDERRYAVFYDKKRRNLVSVRLKFTSKLFEGSGTVIEGDLLKFPERRTIFLATDLPVIGGKTIGDMAAREEALKALFATSTTSTEDVCEFMIREHYQYKHIESLLTEYRDNQIYREMVTGLHFKPLNTKGKDLIYILPEHRRNIGSGPGPRAPAIPAPSSTKALPAIPGLIIPGQRKAPPTPTRAPVAPATPAAPAAAAAPADGTVFIVKADDNLPDVYELFPLSGGDSIGFAAIPDIETTQLMNTLIDQGTTQIRCRWEPRYDKWVPTGRG